MNAVFANLLVLCTALNVYNEIYWLASITGLMTFVNLAHFIKEAD